MVGIPKALGGLGQQSGKDIFSGIWAMPGRMHFSPENHPFILGVNLRKKWMFTLALFMLQKIPTERLNLQNNIWRQVFLFPQFTLHLLLKYLLLKWSPRT